MKSLLESQKEWDKNKICYEDSYDVRYIFSDERNPLSFPCIVVSASGPLCDSAAEYTISFVYLTDFKNESH